MSLRLRLFLNVTAVFLITSLFSIFLQIYFVKQDVKQTASKIKTYVEKQERNISSETIFVFLKNLGDNIVQKISINITLVTLLGLLIALYFLHRIARKVTTPITLLAYAMKEMEEGRLDHLFLPHFETRKDEIGILSHGFSSMVAALKEREKIRGVLNKVVSKEIASKILSSQVELGGEERIVTILFSDIRGFTKMTENIPPPVLIELMNKYLTEVCRIIDQNGGVIDKFVGDEVMALYGAPLDDPQQGVKSILTALAMLESLRQTNQKRKDKGLPPVEIGIGIHTGNVIAGNLGSENRLNYTVLGANVNLASRLCSAAKGMQILISQETLNAPGVKELFLYTLVDGISLKGVTNPTQIFEIKALKPNKNK